MFLVSCNVLIIIIVLRTLMRVPVVKYKMLGLAAKYGLSDAREGLSIIRDSV